MQNLTNDSCRGNGYVVFDAVHMTNSVTNSQPIANITKHGGCSKILGLFVIKMNAKFGRHDAALRLYKVSLQS